MLFHSLTHQVSLRASLLKNHLVRTMSCLPGHRADQATIQQGVLSPVIWGGSQGQFLNLSSVTRPKILVTRGSDNCSQLLRACGFCYRILFKAYAIKVMDSFVCNIDRSADIYFASLLTRKVFGALSYSSPLANSDRTSGVDVSKPVRFSVFESVGSTIVRSLLTMPTTTSFASIPVAARYCCRASWGCTEPK